ncbi:MAG TPA: SRPBCC family protein [Anaerolineales bacterium]|nr:SRPBCC family protein [Anaerolineales bacterium]
MARIESSIIVSKSIEDIFGFLSRCESHLKFIPRMTQLEQETDGAFGKVGTRLSGMLNYFGIRIPVTYELIEVEPLQRLAMMGQMGPVHFKDGYILSSSPQGTQIHFWLELQPTGWAVLMRPFAGVIGRIHAYETLRNLKRVLDGNR